ncbi:MULTISPECIES: hypothetical protein [unclassified Cyanobium]|uniref:hypothetical protein n=1 Tax=unclassified Cyanobium TaxID=2627006 RepID=UPI0020CF0634|nr:MULTISPECIES: hypothetical protein [unclassified Cyanobium]MCP9833122.1 hypothetical protein [Cyanobium sp. La Preciosa 7G6]MCP9936015.1 hypothetical protein [Cyanobium sp. Aljojuca 7A6]
MPSPESSIGSANTDLSRLVAAAADLCRKPLRHAVVSPSHGVSAAEADAETHHSLDLCLRLEARTPEGERLPAEDLELEIYSSGEALNLTLAWCHRDDQPLLWHGSHPVWMDGATGLRSSCPPEGDPLEALARRLRALLQPDQG